MVEAAATIKSVGHPGQTGGGLVPPSPLMKRWILIVNAHFSAPVSAPKLLQL
jgi:hypothetical protein